MRKNYFIPVLIALSLCIGQVASYTHVVSHLNAVAAHDGHADEHHVHNHTASFGDHEHAPDSSNDEYVDCAIYHAFAGTIAVPTICSDLLSVSTAHLSITSDITTAVLVGSFNAHNIRGPPKFS